MFFIYSQNFSTIILFPFPPATAPQRPPWGPHQQPARAPADQVSALDELRARAGQKDQPAVQTLQGSPQLRPQPGAGRDDHRDEAAAQKEETARQAALDPPGQLQPGPAQPAGRPAAEAVPRVQPLQGAEAKSHGEEGIGLAAGAGRGDGQLGGGVAVRVQRGTVGHDQRGGATGGAAAAGHEWGGQDTEWRQ